MEQAVMAHQCETLVATSDHDDRDPREVAAEITQEINRLTIRQLELENNRSGKPTYVVASIDREIGAIKRQIATLCQRMRW